jgi:predicted metal-dependent peptidase
MALIFGKQLTAEQRLEKATIKILSHKGKYEALTGILMYGDVTVDDTTPTACTDGKNEKYGRAFVGTLTDAELRFVRLHEVYHKMYRHLLIWRHLWKEDGALANQACDLVINCKLVDGDDGEGFIVKPACGLLDPQYRGLDAGQVYNLLKKDKKEEEKEEKGEGEPGEGEPGEGEPRVSRVKPGESKPGESKPGEGAGMDEHDWENADKRGSAEEQQISREIDDALRQGGILAGKTGSGGSRDVRELLQAKVDWREVLRDYLQQLVVGKDFTSWRRFNRRYLSQDMYMPAGVKEQVGEILIGIDTSGSIGGTFISQFLGEVKSICETLQPEKIRLVYWDTTVCREEVYLMHELDDLIRTTKPSGGGGTDPRCVTQYMEKNNVKPECIVMLTDGYVGSWGDTWPAPVLWCILNNKAAVPSVGQAVHIDI